MKMWPMVAVAALSSACVWACQGDDGGSGDEGGQGGEGTGGGSSGGGSTGGASTGGSGEGGLGGTAPSCEPDDESLAWGGAGGEGGGGSEDIFGEWIDQYQGTYVITAGSVTTSYAAYDIVGIASEEQYLVARNDETNTYDPCLYSRFDWFVDEDGTYLCQTEYNAESADAARAASPADRGDLAGGCATFPWSTLTPQ